MTFERRFFVPVFTYDDRNHIIRLFRFVWQRGVVGDGSGGYSAKLSLALSPRILSVNKEWSGWIITIIGIRIHYMRSYGGILT